MLLAADKREYEALTDPIDGICTPYEARLLLALERLVLIRELAYAAKLGEAD
jgi:hypothetical protein